MADLKPIDLSACTAEVSPSGTSDDPLLDVATLPDVLVVEEDGVVRGYVRLHQPGPLPSHAHALEVNGLAVDPAHQGRGIGRELVRARRLHGACGFAVEGVLREEFFLREAYVDDVLMAHHLDM